MLTLLECSQDGKLQPILVTARGFFRPDDVVQGRDLHGNTEHGNQSRVVLPLGVLSYSRRVERDIEIPEPSDQVQCGAGLGAAYLDQTPSLRIPQGRAASLDESHICLEPLKPLIDGHCQSRLKQPDVVRIWFRLREHPRQISRTCPRDGVHDAQRRVTVYPRLDLPIRNP
jgi:hypothetical protein